MNPRVAAIEPSVIRALNAKKRPTSIDLGLGEPALMPSMRYFEAASRWIAEHGCRYTANAGDPELRAAVAAHYGYQFVPAESNVCLTTGSQEAVFIAIKALLDPAHDELLVVEPAFPVYAKIAELEGIACRRVALDSAAGFPFDVPRIAAALTPATRMVVICSPCNPTGRVIRAAQVKALADILRAHAHKHGAPVYVLHDEIYRELTFVDDPGYFAQEYEFAVVINSLSKSNALTGLRLGWVGAADDAAKAIVKLHAWVTLCAGTHAQAVAREIFRAGALGEHTPWYARQRAGVISALMDSGLEFVVPDGSFYACVRLPQGRDSLAAATRLVEIDDVVVIPGVIFGASAEGWLRLSWVSELEKFREGLQRIARADNPG